MDQQQAQPQQAQAEPGGDDQIVQGMMMVKDALSAMTESLSGSIPPEAEKALQMAKQAYDQFMSASGMQQDEQSQGNQPEMTAGKSGAIPADQPTRPGAKAY